MKYAIYISKNGEVIGPFTKKELREAVHCGNISSDDWAWHKELPEWNPVHTLIPIIHVARCGEEISKFDDEQDILSGLRDGSLLMDDYYWCEGMSEWKHLSALEISKGALATTAQKDALKAAGLPFDELTTKAQVTALFSAGRNAPASAKQLALLSYLGRPVSANISKKEAADRIDTIVGDSDGADKFRDWNDDKLILVPDIYADEIAARKKECFGEYNTFRKELGSAASELPRIAMCMDHFLPCVEAKIHLSPIRS